MVGLTAAKHRQLREYSKGMQRRIGLAQALINNPELILLDEPTSGLDPIGTAEIKELIRELRDQGKTIVLSGHLLADMQDICDRIAILHRGELKELGKVSDLLTVQDITQIKTRDLPEAASQEIREVIARHGGELVAVDHPTTTLEELFLRIVRESDLHPGRRRVRRDRQAAGLQGRTGRPPPRSPDARGLENGRRPMPVDSRSRSVDRPPSSLARTSSSIHIGHRRSPHPRARFTARATSSGEPGASSSMS